MVGFKRRMGNLHPFRLSGRRDSNPRLSAWKAEALPTELLPHKIGILYQLNYFRINLNVKLFLQIFLCLHQFQIFFHNKDKLFLFFVLYFYGEGRIRTFEDIRQQIYSLPPLATWVPPHKLAEGIEPPT